MKKINKITYLKYKKQLQELYALGKKYDKEKDPEKQAILKEEIIKRCQDLKGKLNLKECSEEDLSNIIGFPNPAANNDENDCAADVPAADTDNQVC